MMTPKEATEGLLKAAQEGNTAQIKLYLSEGADVHARSKIANKTALHLVMEKGDVAAVNALLAAGADMESKDQYGNNALYCAAFFGRKDIAIILLLRGADYRSVSSADHCTPLQIAKNHGHPDIAALMNEEAIARLRQEVLEEPLHLSTAVESKQAIITAIKSRQVDALYELLRTETGLTLFYSNRGEEGARDVGDAGIRVIAEAIGRGGLALEKLVFWDVGITDDGAVALCRELSHIPVKHLQFSYNRITDTGAQVLAELLPPELEHLDLGANQITDHGARSIAAAVRGHRHLKHIHLGCDRVTPASIPAFIDALEENTSLVELVGTNYFFTQDATLAALLQRNKESIPTPVVSTVTDSSTQSETDLGRGRVEGGAEAPPLESAKTYSERELQAVDQLVENVILGALSGLPSSADYKAVSGAHMYGQLSSDKERLLRDELRDCICKSRIYADSSQLTVAQESQLLYGVTEVVRKYLRYEPRKRLHLFPEPDHVHTTIKKGKILGHAPLRAEIDDVIEQVRKAEKIKEAVVKP